MPLLRWVVYVFLMPLTPIFVALFIVSGQPGPTTNLSEMLGGTELYFIALVILAFTARDVETARGNMMASDRFQLLRTSVLVATVFVAMTACFVYIDERVIELGLFNDFLMALGVVTTLLASGLSIVAQAMLARYMPTDAPGSKRKRVAVEQ